VLAFISTRPYLHPTMRISSLHHDEMKLH